jgi:hypothetical protein
MTGPNASGKTAVLPPLQCSSAFEVGLAGEHHEDSEARVERRLARSARHALAGIMGLPRQAGRRARNPPTDQLAKLLATSASAFDSFQRQIEAEPEMAVTFAVQIEVSPLQRDGQVLLLLQLDRTSDLRSSLATSCLRPR